PTGGARRSARVEGKAALPPRLDQRVERGERGCGRRHPLVYTPVARLFLAGASLPVTPLSAPRTPPNRQTHEATIRALLRTHRPRVRPAGRARGRSATEHRRDPAGRAVYRRHDGDPAAPVHGAAARGAEHPGLPSPVHAGRAGAPDSPAEVPGHRFPRTPAPRWP